MPTITLDLTEQELATLTLAAKLRGSTTQEGTPDWAAFYRPWHSDAYAQVQRAAGTLVADDPALSAEMMARLDASLTAAPTEEVAP